MKNNKRDENREKNEKIFEKMEFDDVSKAQKILTKSETRLKIAKIGLIISLVGTVLIWVGLAIPNQNLGGNIASIGLIAGFVSHFLAEGIIFDLKVLWKVAKGLWFAIPIFPVDLLFVCIEVSMGGTMWLIVPVLFGAAGYHQIKLDYSAAAEYLEESRSADM